MRKNMDRDLMLIALLIKGIEIIDIEASPQYENLRKTFESELNTIKIRLSNEFRREQKIEQKKKMSDEDKQFIVDELLGILGGKVSGTQTYTPNPAVSKFFGDYIRSAWNLDNEKENIQKKKDDLMDLKKWNRDNWESF